MTSINTFLTTKILTMLTPAWLRLCNFFNLRKRPQEFQSVELLQRDMHAYLFQTFWDQCDTSYVKPYSGVSNLVNDLVGKHAGLGALQKALKDKPITGRFNKVRFICLLVNNQPMLLMDVTCLDVGLMPVMIYSEEKEVFIPETDTFVKYVVKYNFDFGHTP